MAEAETKDGARKPRALVTGGIGFLGSHLCESLRAEGYRVLCLDNRITGSLDISWLAGRLAERQEVLIRR